MNSPLQTAIDNALEHHATCSAHTQQRIQALIHSPQPRYLIGKNTESLAALQWLPFAGLIDDTAQPHTQWNGLPVLPMRDVSQHAWVLNCTSSIAPVNVQRALYSAGLHNTLHLGDLLPHPECPATLHPAFMTEQRTDYAQHPAEWDALYHRLADEESRNTLLDVLRFRLTAHPMYMQQYNVRLREQYFEEFLHLNQDVFVDAGGFDGDTTEEFCKRAPHYRKVFLFEPAAANMAAAKRRLANHRHIEFIEQGLSDQAATLSFDPDAGSACAVSQQSQHTIRVNTLDAMVSEPVTFIKMDLEGWELHALAGCKQHIHNNHPKLALSVYHQASHFRDIMHTVLSMHPHYQVRLRHYTQGWSETVMFFTSE